MTVGILKFVLAYYSTQFNTLHMYNVRYKLNTLHIYS